MDEEQTVAHAVVAAALQAGAGEAEALLAVSKRFSCEARDTTVAKLEQSVSRGLTLRVYAGGAKATLSTTDFSKDGLASAARTVVEAARFVAPDPYAGLSDQATSGDAGDLGIDDPSVGARDPRVKVDEALTLERLVRAFDPRITNSSGSRVSDSAARIAYANSRGSRGSYTSTTVLRSTVPIALDGSIRRNAAYGSASRRLDGLEPVDGVATRAAKRAIDQCGARKPPSMKVPVIFERDVAAAVLGDLFSGVSAAGSFDRQLLPAR